MEYPGFGAVPILYQLNITLDTTYSCLYPAATVNYLGLIMLIPRKKRTLQQRVDDYTPWVMGVIGLALTFTYLWMFTT